MPNDPTPEEIFHKIYCLCGHLISSEDENGHEDDKCYALDYIGLTLTACRCRKARPVPFVVKVEIDAEISNDQRKLAA